MSKSVRVIMPYGKWNALVEDSQKLKATISIWELYIRSTVESCIKSILVSSFVEPYPAS